eukprot:3007726-Pleurochrysis_carterae.AAC.2
MDEYILSLMRTNTNVRLVAARSGRACGAFDACCDRYTISITHLAEDNPAHFVSGPCKSCGIGQAALVLIPGCWKLTRNGIIDYHAPKQQMIRI